MKKVCCFLCTLVLLCGMMPAFAAQNGARCNKHPNAAVKEEEFSYCYAESKDYHRIYRGLYIKCSVCDSILYDRGDIPDEKTNPHTYVNDKCTQCGQTRSGGTSSSTVPSMGDLQYAARYLGDQVIGATAKVIYAGNVRDAASNTARIIGKVQADETYNIISYQVADNGSIWFEIQYGRRKVWMSAGLAEVILSEMNTDGELADLVGRQIVITIVSGSTRRAPGTSSDRAGSVYRGERYTILGCDYDNEGKLWYEIRNGRVNCWISSGVAKLQ